MVRSIILKVSNIKCTSGCNSCKYTTETLLLSHLDEASGRQGVHEGMAPGILLQHVRDEPHRGGVHLLQPDKHKTAGSHKHTPSPSRLTARRKDHPFIQKRIFFSALILRSPSVLTRSRRGLWGAGCPAVAERWRPQEAPLWPRSRSQSAAWPGRKADRFFSHLEIKKKKTLCSYMSRPANHDLNLANVY